MQTSQHLADDNVLHSDKMALCFSTREAFDSKNKNNRHTYLIDNEEDKGK